MNEYFSFVDWLVGTVTTFWNFWMNQHFALRASLLSPFLMAIVGLIYSTLHDDV